MSTNDLQEAVRSVSKGNVYLPAAIKDTVISELFHLRDSSDPLKILSNRELQIFNLVARGKRIKEIAGALCLSQKTIENHLSHILSKLNLKRSIDLVLFAQRNGLIPPS
jgi:DNA-binding NarL/FixJ family response regulator